MPFHVPAPRPPDELGSADSKFTRLTTSVVSRLILPTGLAATLLVLASLESASPASASTTGFRGAATGSATCTVSGTVHFSPPLTPTGGGTKRSKVSGVLTGCRSSNPSVRISGGRLTGSFARSPIECSPVTGTGATASLTASWKGRLEGRVRGTEYSGRARFAPSTVSESGEQLIPASKDSKALFLPGLGAVSNVTGSFSGGSRATLYSRDSDQRLDSMCHAASGLRAMPFYGTVTIGNGASVYSRLSIDYPTRIASGADAKLWFTNFDNGDIGTITTTGVLSKYTVKSSHESVGITAGPDGALWFTNEAGNSIGRITTAGKSSSYRGRGISSPTAITTGPDGALWFTNRGNNSIGRITTAGVVSNFTAPSIDGPGDITAGPDGALWFTNQGNDSIGRITTSGVVSDFTAPSIDGPGSITAGPDGALWFTNFDGNSIGRITPGGRVSSYSDPNIDEPGGIVAGPDGALWFTNEGGNSIGRLATDVLGGS